MAAEILEDCSWVLALSATVIVAAVKMYLLLQW